MRLQNPVLVLAMLGIIILSLGCQRYTFESAFAEMSLIDKKYNTSFYTEALDVENVFSDNLIYDYDWERTILDENLIESYLQDMAQLRDSVQRRNSEDMNAILMFIDARRNMLESERLYLKGLAVGDKGNSKKGLACKNKEYVFLLSDYYNQSNIIGQNATAIMDKLLTHYTVTKEFLSGDNRPKFYDSPFWPIRKFSIYNKDTVEQLCNAK